MLIAIAAATAALWFTLRVRGALQIGAAALVMGVAVTGMHYTGMYALSVEAQPGDGADRRGPAIDFMLPLIVGISVVTMGLLLALVLSPRNGSCAGSRSSSTACGTSAAATSPRQPARARRKWISSARPAVQLSLKRRSVRLSGEEDESAPGPALKGGRAPSRPRPSPRPTARRLCR